MVFFCSSSITSLCVFFTSVGMVLHLQALYSSVGVVITSEGVVLPFSVMVLPLWAWFYL